jgi:hypothetical protein
VIKRKVPVLPGLFEFLYRFKLVTTRCSFKSRPGHKVVVIKPKICVTNFHVLFLLPKDKVIFDCETSDNPTFTLFFVLMAVRKGWCRGRSVIPLDKEITMKTLLKVLFIVVLGALISCGKPGKDTTASDPVEEDANQALYDQVMDIHDEVMPKMDDLYKLKKQLQDSIAKTPAMVEEAKKELELTIQQLDSASNSMMVWMRQFNPPTDSTSEEALREYLEAQLEMVKKMREDVMGALDKGKKQN